MTAVKNPTDGSPWMVQVLSTSNVVFPFGALRARRRFSKVVCREDLNYPHTAVWGILMSFLSLGLVRLVKQRNRIPRTPVRGWFKSFLLAMQSFPPARLARRRRFSRVVCRKDLNYPHTAVWGILILRNLSNLWIETSLSVVTPSSARWSRTVDRTVLDLASRRHESQSTFPLSQPCHRP